MKIEPAVRQYVSSSGGPEHKVVGGVSDGGVRHAAVMPRDSLHPWQRALLLYLRRLHPVFGPLSLLTATSRGAWLGVDGLPEDIRRVVTSIAILPPVTDIGSDPLVPGSWCWGVPLWGNPFLPVGLPGQPGVLGLEHHYHIRCSFIAMPFVLWVCVWLPWLNFVVSRTRGIHRC
ncbi:hypothetical protein Agub_g14952 [Astrephomene gubernaculifera]|uniref:Uncharacterized protein n=1 Tax=Astrephomene gubernaculifera TaxID=47775 RepID=A0AAD3E4S3_9CHLO|nr:hypothetical protein Agub_g14952 [Astrephomene gubernaculifera]